MRTDRSRIAPSFSLYLDLVRFVAALLVVFTHYRQYGVAGGWGARLLPDAGREAVIAFFVLSGLVIAYSSSTHPMGLKQFLAARFSRIYSVVLPVLALSFATAALLLQLVPSAAVPAYVLHKAYVYFPLHLLFMGELWQFAETPPLVPPWWSLAYEVWYYLLFGVCFYLRGRTRMAAALLVFLVMGLKLWLMLPIWLAGVALFDWLGRAAVKRTAARIGWAVSLLLLAAWNVAGLEDALRAWSNASWNPLFLRLGEPDRLLGDYIVCALIVVNFACARFADFESLMRHAAAIRTLSFYTFPLYLAHALVLGVWRAQPHAAPGGAADVLVTALGVIAATWALGRGGDALRRASLAWIARRGARKAAPESATLEGFHRHP